MVTEVATPKTDSKPVTPMANVKTTTLTIGDCDVVVREPNALEGLRAIAIVSRYLKQIFATANTKDLRSKSNTELAIVFFDVIQKSEVNAIDDVFALVGLLSGLDPEWLKTIPFSELANVLSAIMSVNNMAGIIRTAVSLTK